MEQEVSIENIVKENGLEPRTGSVIVESFNPFFEQAQEWKKKAMAIEVTDVSQIYDMKIAHDMRMALVRIRIDADKKRKLLKEDSNRYGKAVQGVYNVIEYLIMPVEEHLERQEKFAEIQIAKQKATLQAIRSEEVKPYSIFVPVGVDLGSMSDEEYQRFYKGLSLQMQAEELKVAKAKALAEKKALQAPDKDKLLKLAQDIRMISVENLQSAEAKKAADIAIRALGAVADVVEAEARKL